MDKRTVAQIDTQMVAQVFIILIGIKYQQVAALELAVRGQLLLIGLTVHIQIALFFGCCRQINTNLSEYIAGEARTVKRIGSVRHMNIRTAQLAFGDFNHLFVLHKQVYHFSILLSRVSFKKLK